jgi:hypothetical protein
MEECRVRTEVSKASLPLTRQPAPANALVHTVATFRSRFDEGEPAIYTKRRKDIYATGLHHPIHQLIALMQFFVRRPQQPRVWHRSPPLFCGMAIELGPF